MTSIKILTVVGARPQFIKAGALSRAIMSSSEVEEVLVHTGQHFDESMSDVFFSEMEIPRPKYNLEVNSLGHGAMTGRMMEKLEEVVLRERPDLVLVYGDTNSTLAGALVAAKLHIPVGHVEAGLRSFDMKMPEEINRILTDRVSNILFCPTDSAIENLKSEGYDRFQAKVVRSGDVMQDAAIYYSQRSDEHSDIISRLDLTSSGFALCTLHRAENTDDESRLIEIIDGLNEINTELPVILPLHPRTKKVLESSSIMTNIRLIDPVSYFGMIELLKHCRMVITDSGGLQKEAFFFRKPCITTRDQTEWVELVDHGFNKVVGASKANMLKAYMGFMQNEIPSFEVDLYGSGTASEVIISEIVAYFKERL